MPREPSQSSPSVDHATLLAAVGRGNGASSETVRREGCKRIAAQVYRVVAAVLGPGSPDVGDAVQEAFMRVYRAIPTFVYDATRPFGPVAWVNQIALRAALDRLREQKQALENEQDFEPAEPFAEDDPESAVAQKALVAALLQRLTEKERAVLVLKYWNGETDEEIAETLALPLGTVKTRLRAAAEKLRRGARADAAALEALVPEGAKA